jgi:opacity protein-like surface antigen
VLLITVQLFAQENEPGVIERSGMRALLFNVNEFNLTSFNGGIGLKEWTSNRAVSFGMIRGSFSKTKKDKTENLSGSEGTQISGGFKLGREIHFMLGNDLSPYFSFALGFDYEKTKNKIESYRRFDYFYVSTSSEEVQTEAFSIALEVSLGMEYFITDKISIGGQYNLAALYKGGEEKIKTYYEDKRDFSEFKIGLTSSSFILSFYF